MPRITPPGTYRFFDTDAAEKGTVQINADGTWHWRGVDGTVNTGKWGDVGLLTHFVDQRKHTVAKRDATGMTLYDATGPWMNISLDEKGSLEE